MRWTLPLVLVAGLVTAMPCAADYVLEWTHAANFPGSPNPAGGSLPAGYFGDFDGDGRLEVVLQPVWDNTILLEIRDALDGTLEGSINLQACCGGYVKSVSVLQLPTGFVGILVTAGTIGNADQNMLALFSWRNVSGVQSGSGADTAIPQARPNPFRQGTVIDFALSSSGMVAVEIFDVAGRLVRGIELGRLTAGTHQAEWNGNDQSGRRIAGGTYFYVLKVDGVLVGSRKAVLLN